MGRLLHIPTQWWGRRFLIETRSITMLLLNNETENCFDHESLGHLEYMYTLKVSCVDQM